MAFAIMETELKKISCRTIVHLTDLVGFATFARTKRVVLAKIASNWPFGWACCCSYQIGVKSTTKRQKMVTKVVIRQVSTVLAGFSCCWPLPPAMKHRILDLRWPIRSVYSVWQGFRISGI